MAHSPLTVTELISAYRLTNLPDRRREDMRHGQWWTEHLGALPVSELTTARILGALERVRAEGPTGARAGSTVAFYLRFLRRVTAWGTCMTMLPSDPCAGIPLPKEPTPSMRVLTEDEEAQLCQALGSPYSLWVRFAILTGVEQSEQFTLLWRAVQLDRARMQVPQGTNGGMVELSLVPDAVTILHALRHTYPTSLWVFPDPKNSLRPADPHNFYVSRWTRTIERLGMPPVAWKDLRHTCGVRLAKQGVPVGEIATFLRQRELRQAYRYRAWMPGERAKPTPPQPARQPVFQEVTAHDLKDFESRDTKAHPFTFGEICRFYAVHYLKARRARRDFDSIYRNHISQWGDRCLHDLKRKEIRLWHMGKSDIPSQANKAVNCIRAVYNWASELDLYEGVNPAVGRFRYTCRPRERFLFIEEMKRFLAGIETLPAKPRVYLWTMLLTGARGIEIRTMRWTDIDWTTGLWKKPKTKNGTTQYLPLPLQAVTALSTLPRGAVWVFPGVNGRPWSGASAEKLWLRLRRQWNLEDVTLHDIRRTCASYLSIANENLPTIQSVLNHRSLVQTSTYARLNTGAVDRALQAQADRLCNMMEGPDVLPALTHS